MSYPTNELQHLTIDGVDAVTLAKTYGTPLYVYDVTKIRQTMRAFKTIFEKEGVPYVVSYASKAFATQAIYQVAQQEGIHADIVSGGELFTALQAGFDPKHLSFNGNNKSWDELTMAIEAGVGMIIVDNFLELQLLSEIAAKHNMTQDILLRISPGISAHTHEFISTGQQDSKFGFDLLTGQGKQAYDIAKDDQNLNLLGLHAHIGSQIFDVTGFEKNAALLADTAQSWGWQPAIINVGGGFGIRYTDEDTPLPESDYADAIIRTLKSKAAQYDWKMPEIWIEPGRSVVGPAGQTLYTVGSRKDIPDLRQYLAVDGGMGDNIRPALYQANYDAVLANQPNAPTEEVVRVAGKYCESGDVLVWQQALPRTQPGDILSVLATGAYGYAMASNYNRNPRPGVVFVENGQHQLVVARETYANLTALDKKYTLGKANVQ
ncbi:diaminopimelate decarboxylase [Leuconostoc kimchii IMSNU 11154]|uniref:Diaminopimelate decarboxylase n=1 Tax=Leuconostoc kimchii (strain IMSNU 11154 / KCTC 2386 / IH25) TaxID=762051 RepID=D5T5H8_LEUKI|nr:diaminopimelate decarboxylase [Leuconostoc kimchii]ADG41308.1 diaminopimelate decarboxylase [Leuconostoc kimchii IMSNU 11154]